MGIIDVRSPDGRLWNVQRRWTSWLPRRIRYRKRMERASTDEYGTPKLTYAQMGEAMGGRYPTTPDSPAIKGVLELPVEAFVALANLFRRVVLRRPWRIDVYNDRGRLRTVERCGWDDSLRLCRDLAAQLRAGTPLEELVLPPERGDWQPVHPEPADVLRQRQGPVS